MALEETSEAAVEKRTDICLEINSLVTSFKLGKQTVNAVDNCSFLVRRGRTLGVVGESGCGKSVTSLSIMRLIPSPPGKIESGKILFDNCDLLTLSESEMRKIRGNRISMIFQEPMTSLNPVYTIGNQISEVFLQHRGVSRHEAKNLSIEMLMQVKIPSPEKRIAEYPHQLSGGMRQRIMIAMALACKPALLIADEPTTALDVTIQAQILALMNNLQLERNMSIILITHDLGVVAETCDDVVVMYAGKIVERAPSRELFLSPAHPYTLGLLASIPRLGQKLLRLTTIPGMVPKITEMPVGCRFQDRCLYVQEICKQVAPELKSFASEREVACHFPKF